MSKRLLCLMLLIAGGVAFGADVEFTEVDERVKFSAPESWLAGPHKVVDGMETYAFQIPNPAEEGTTHATNVAVFGGIREDDADIEAFSSERLMKSSRPNTVLMGQMNLGENARQVIQKSELDGAFYVLVHSFVRQGQVYVHVKGAHPLLEGNTKAWESEFRTAMDRLFLGIRIDDQEVLKPWQP